MEAAGRGPLLANYSTSGAYAEGGILNEFAKGVGRFFYLSDPAETSFQQREQVPNFFRQSWPYFMLFIILEHCVLRLEGKAGIRVNDGLTSISNGLFQECGRLLWRGAESFMYSWIFTNWRILDLSWDSAYTWYAAALGVDFCYYWVHRACHEVHILWAQHQVHHSSEDFNMAVGLRQSVLQGWCGFIFYLPLALVIPPSHFLTHQQFSLLYQFWIHTEAVNHLGPLEYVFNTPRHHRVHHGCNKYCLDTNYGGVLIIWDRLFGTFAEERNKNGIVYGLVFNQPSFNPLHLQSFYSAHVVSKYRSMESWRMKTAAVLYGPSWAPGTPRLGNEKDKMNITHREKYDVALPIWCNVYLLMHFGVVLIGFHELALRHMGMTPISVLYFVSYVLASLTVIGMLFDGNTKAPLMEIARCTVLAFLANRYLASGWSPVVAFTLQIFYIISAMCWSLNTLKILEIKRSENTNVHIEDTQ